MIPGSQMEKIKITGCFKPVFYLSRSEKPAKYPFTINSFVSNIMGSNETYGFAATNDFSILLPKSATVHRIYLNSMSTFKLTSLLWKIFKMRKLNLWLLRSNYVNGTHVFWDTLIIIYYFFTKPQSHKA